MKDNRKVKFVEKACQLNGGHVISHVTHFVPRLRVPELPELQRSFRRCPE